MKQLKYYFMIGFLLHSGVILSQSIRANDLIGKWTQHTDTTISKTRQNWDFKNDSLLIITDSSNPYYSPGSILCY
jgi:hypothetical protein